MRKVKLTKDIIKKNAVFFGLTKKQLIGMGATVLVALAVVSPAFMFDLNIDIFATLSFIILALGVSIFIIRVNGKPLLIMLFEAFFTIEDVRYYARGGLKDEKKINENKNRQ